MRKIIFSLLLLLISIQSYAYNVGLLIMATGRYIAFVEPLINSARKHFCTNHTVTYFVFTDGEPPLAEDIVKIEQRRLGWPYDTLLRLPIYFQHRKLYKEMDYLFATDADMLFVNEVGDEILSDRVATQHPGFVGRRGTYETNPRSTAYVVSDEGSVYVAGGFNGGSTAEFLAMAERITANILLDQMHNIMAIWHDESHINRYFIDNPPTMLLSPSYCYPESWHLPYVKRLLALDKNHGELRR